MEPSSEVLQQVEMSKVFIRTSVVHADVPDGDGNGTIEVPNGSNKMNGGKSKTTADFLRMLILEMRILVWSYCSGNM